MYPHFHWPPPTHRALLAWPRSGRAESARASRLFQEAGQLARSPKLRDRFELLKGRCERIRQAPERAALELLVLRVKVQIVDWAGQVFRHLQPSFDERAVDDQFG